MRHLSQTPCHTHHIHPFAYTNMHTTAVISFSSSTAQALQHIFPVVTLGTQSVSPRVDTPLQQYASQPIPLIFTQMAAPAPLNSRSC